MVENPKLAVKMFDENSLIVCVVTDNLLVTVFVDFLNYSKQNI